MCLMPHDDTERDRLDILHAMIILLRDPNRRLTNTPTSLLAGRRNGSERQRVPRVLDLGCGTGIWMLEMARRFHDAEFVGVDIHRMGPTNLEPNVTYTAPWNYEDIWQFGGETWDLIHLQMGLGSVADWGRLFTQTMLHLTPATGYFELVEVDFQPRVMDGELPPGMLRDWWHKYLKDSYDMTNRPLEYNPTTPDILAHMGFKDVEHQEFLIPLSDWSDDHIQTRAAMWWQIAMGPGDDGSGGYGLEALSLKCMCTFHRWQVDHVKRMCNEAYTQAVDPRFRVYNVLHVITCRAPTLAERPPLPPILPRAGQQGPVFAGQNAPVVAGPSYHPR
jgi:SAM-dependent methyltransferase